MKPFPAIDMKATGEKIQKLRVSRGLTVKDIQDYMGFSEPQSVYKWLWGKNLPSTDHLFALAKLLEVPVEEILVTLQPVEQQDR